ncbi:MULTISPECIES: hypothetical protein [Sphingobium]|uniref:Uncharacterized protein n=1 Tax=Sphingobium yanoikuyae TaxID=13690 RepID=A0A6M4GCS2_SPHYA|nr:hypothetical protein [Sphingobium yanoikuyae]QJR04073.1 hypothetical protein HH800_18850 [Sphingobium yanoikuyae]QNG45204.1 hypothetical protein H3V42_25880 [Sphingobium yanoikuyae]
MIGKIEPWRFKIEPKSMSSAAIQPLGDPVPDHARVVDAIARRDPRKARTSMEILIALALEDMKTVLDG